MSELRNNPALAVRSWFMPDPEYLEPADLPESVDGMDAAVRTRMKELQSWTLSYDLELDRLTQELNESRVRQIRVA